MGIEIATDPYNLRDGKPIFLNMGVHHAREWPSSEHAIEWAYDLLTNYGSSGRTTRLVRATRNIVVPIVNPDGFNISREAPDFPPETEFDAVRLRDEAQELLAGPRLPVGRVRQQRARPAGCWAWTPTATTAASGAARAPASIPLDDTFRGTAPFSEPETQNIRELQSERQVTNLITNHTYSNLVLRPPGVADTRPRSRSRCWRSSARR